MRPQDANSIIKHASKHALLASENAAYFELFEENMQLKADMKAKEYVGLDICAYILINICILPCTVPLF